MPRGAASVQCADSDTTLTADRALQIGVGAARSRSDLPAMECFLFAADRGNASAQLDVGHAYEAGTAVAADPVKALDYYLKAARQGNTRAQLLVAQYFANGSAGSADKPEADRWTAILAKTRAQHERVCASASVFREMQIVERQYARNDAGRALSSVAQAVTGLPVTSANDEPTLIQAHGTDKMQYAGRFVVDMGRVPGEFLCLDIFIHGKRTTQADADNEHNLTVKAAQKLLDMFPSFQEVFAVLPLPDGRYRVTVLPQVIWGNDDKAYSGITAR